MQEDDEDNKTFGLRWPPANSDNCTSSYRNGKYPDDSVSRKKTFFFSSSSFSFSSPSSSSSSASSSSSSSYVCVIEGGLNTVATPVNQQHIDGRKVLDIPVITNYRYKNERCERKAVIRRYEYVTFLSRATRPISHSVGWSVGRSVGRSVPILIFWHF